jgi:hypothetical protein
VIRGWLEQFFRTPPATVRPVYNERALQLELAIALRSDGFEVEFERSFKAPRPDGSTLKPKHNLDLLVRGGDQTTAIELKVPLNGQHPETMYAFCADVEFVEALRRQEIVDCAYCLMLTNDKAFWDDSGRGSAIHNIFRCADVTVSGLVQKPTGARDTTVMLGGKYGFAAGWGSVSPNLMQRAKVLLVEI